MQALLEACSVSIFRNWYPICEIRLSKPNLKISGEINKKDCQKLELCCKLSRNHY
jgi:hypothetical protein